MASLRHISSYRPQHIIREGNLETCHFCGTLETIFIIGGFPRGCQWFSLLITAQSISLMFDFKFIYSHGLKCTWFDGVEDPGISGDYTVIISPPGLRLELCISDTCIHWHHRSTVYLVVAMIIVLSQDPHCMSGGYTCHDSFYHGSTLYFSWP